MSVRRSSKRGLVEGPAVDAPEADRGEAKRVRKAPPSSDAAAATAAEERRLKADTAKATSASRRDAFDKFPSTEGLWAWGKDCVGWKVPAASMHKRDVVLAALVTLGAPLIKSQKKFAANWRHRCMKVDDKKSLPPPDADSSSEDEDEEELDDDAVAAEASRAEAEHRAQSAREKAASAAAATTKKNTATTQSNPSAPPLRACTHCTDEQPRASPVFRCDTCHMRSDLPFDAQQNVYFRSTAGAPASSGQSDTETSSVRTPKETLSRRDKELERLAEEGAPFPRFDDAAPMSSAEALEAVRDSLWATNYSDPSASLIKLVRSGKLTKVGFALPRPASQTQTRADFADTGILFLNGRSEATGNVVAPPLQNYDEFMHALLSVIAPALIDRPRALLDWFALARTVHEINREHDWPTARQYLDSALADRVTRRAPFGTYDRRIYDAITKPRGGGGGGAGGGRSAGSAHYPAAAAASSSAAAPRAAHVGAPDILPGHCRDWNIGKDGCRRLKCDYTHECFWIACKSGDRNHVGKTCASRPPVSGGTAPTGRNSGRGAQAGGARARG